MTPNPEMIPTDPQIDTEMIPISLHVDPEMIPLILGMEWCSVTELLQVCCSVYVLESHSTFHNSLCDFLALLSSNRLYVYFCIFNSF